MKKIILREDQAEILMDKIINEQEDGGRYRQDVICNFDYHGVTYNGKDIDDVSPIKLTLSFDLDIESRRYGITGIQVHNIKGPSEIDTEIIYYESGYDNDSVDGQLKFNIDWNSAVTEKLEDLGWLGIDGEITIELINDHEGNIIINKITIPIRSV